MPTTMPSGTRKRLIDALALAGERRRKLPPGHDVVVPVVMPTVFARLLVLGRRCDPLAEDLLRRLVALRLRAGRRNRRRVRRRGPAATTAAGRCRDRALDPEGLELVRILGQRDLE